MAVWRADNTENTREVRRNLARAMTQLLTAGDVVLQTSDGSLHKTEAANYVRHMSLREVNRFVGSGPTHDRNGKIKMTDHIRHMSGVG